MTVEPAVHHLNWSCPVWVDRGEGGRRCGAPLDLVVGDGFIDLTCGEHSWFDVTLNMRIDADGQYVGFDAGVLGGVS